MPTDDTQIKMFLIDSGLVSRSDILNAERKGNILNELVATGKLSDTDAKKLIAHSLGMPFVDLNQIDPEALLIIPEPISRKHCIVAYKKNNSVLEVALLDAASLKEIEFLKHRGFKILPRLTDIASMRQALLQYQKLMKQKFGEKISAHIKSPGENSGKRITETLLEQAKLQHATEIVIEPRANDTLVRFRLSGVLQEAMILPKDIQLSFANARTYSIPTQYGEKITVKLPREGVSGFSLEELGFHGPNKEKIWEILRNPSGLIITAGPRASGKTATLYTLLDLVSAPHLSVGTIEEPIEYQMKHINQSAVNHDIGLNLTSGLRNLLKQDTDIIMVSSVSDKDTLSLACSAAERGRPVFASHTAGSIDEVLQSLKNLVAHSVSAIQAVIFQRLLRKLGPAKESYYLTKEQIKALGMKADMEKLMQILKEEGIVSQNGTWEDVPFSRPIDPLSPNAYSGRTAVCEVWLPNSTQISIFEDGLIKAASGIVSLDEVRVAL